MSIEIIRDTLTALNGITQWKCVLVEYKHKKRPNEFTAYDFSFAKAEQRSSLLQEICDATVAVIDKNQYTVQPYAVSNAKNVIEKLPLDSKDISEAWQAFSDSVEDSDDTVEWSKVNASAYAFRGTYETEDNERKKIYLISKNNPVKNFKKRKTFGSFLTDGMENAVARFEEPLLQFNAIFECIVIDNNLYGINLNFEPIFNLPYTRKKLTKANLTEIKESGIIEKDSYTILENFSLKGHTPKRYLTFQEDRLEKLKDLRKRKPRAGKLGLKLNQDGKFILETDGDAKQLVNYLCKRLAVDIEDNTTVEY